MTGSEQINRIWIECAGGAFEGLVSSGADLDSTFLAYDRDAAEFVEVNGWTCTVEIDAADVECDSATFRRLTSYKS